MAIAKITLNGQTQMDVTGKTVTAASMLNGTTALKNDGTDITGNIASKSSSDLTVGGATVTAPAGYYPNAASKTIPNADVTVGDPSFAYTTESGARKWGFGYSAYTESAGYIGGGQFGVHSYKYNAIAANTSVTPTESAQTIGGVNTMMEGAVTVNAIPSNYVGSGITQRSSSDLTASGATVTAPAGYYGSAATKSVDAMTLPTAASSSSNSGTRKATIGRSTSTQYINIPIGYNDTKAYYQVSAVANGSATTPATTVTANPSISVSSGGLITATASATKSVTPTVNAGYVSSGTAGTITVSGSNTSQLSTQAAQTIHPSATDQTVASGKYLTGAQTIKAVKITVLEDALVYSSPISRTATGITFDFNADKSCYVHGTATGVGANGQYFINQSAIPSYIQLGVEYTVEYSSAKVYFQIWDYSGGNLTKLLETKTNTTFTFPTTMTGALIRLVVENGVTVNETVHPRLYLPRTTGLSGADILEGIILEIGDADDSDRILSVTGTATRT